ncbi:hypothetical protein GF362_00755 [Candidatus Dojkabacteria bacterium]|nr:hypothetical protein [Candidatus Dojkabacteria bacterium]
MKNKLPLFNYAILFLFIFIFQIFTLTNSYAQIFNDISSDYEFYNYIEDLKQRNIIDGYTDGTFRPNNKLTRGELSKIVTNAFSLKADSKSNNFLDLEETDTFYDYIITLNQLGIINGYSDGTFRSYEKVTRGQAMKFIVNSVKLSDNEKFVEVPQWTIFPDVDESNTFFNYINSATSIKLNDGTRIIKGYSTGEFGVNNNITRAEISKVISQTLNYYENGGTFEPPLTYQEANNELAGVDENNEILAIYSIKTDSTITIIREYEKTDLQVNEQMWGIITNVIPENRIQNLSKFNLFTDGEKESLAGIYRDAYNLENFNFMIDYLDIYQNSTINETLLEYATIHELGHIISLNSEQITITKSLYTAKTIEEMEEMKGIAELLCTNYYAFDGCSKDNSYINSFVNTFWTEEQLNRLEEIYNADTDEEQNQLLNDFYWDYENDFVTLYALSAPTEDFAESFTHFITHERPEDTTFIKDQKTEFFYSFPELVDLRNDIRIHISEDTKNVDIQSYLL